MIVEVLATGGLRSLKMGGSARNGCFPSKFKMDVIAFRCDLREVGKVTKDRRFKPSNHVRAPRHLSPAATEFEQRADHILAEYSAKLTAEVVRSPYQAKEAYLKRASYGLIREYLRAPGRYRTIKSIVRRWHREPRSPSFSENPFFWGLIAVDPQADVLNPARIHLYSQQQLYAHRHDVPPHFLIGFLYQSGNPGDLSHKVASGYREEWFEQLTQDAW